jgi:hypothetical protein
LHYSPARLNTLKGGDLLAKIYRVYTSSLSPEDKEALRAHLSDWSFMVHPYNDYLQVTWDGQEVFPSSLSLMGCKYEDVTANPL